MQPKFLTDVPPHLVREMLSLYRTVDSRQVTDRLWDEVLTPADKRILPETLRNTREECIADLWVRTRGGTVPRAIIDILTALDMIGPAHRARLLRDLGEEEEDPDETVRIATQKTRLVITDSPRKVYWEGEELQIDWIRRSALWECLLALSKATKRGEALDALSLNWENRTLINRKSQLKKQVGTTAESFAECFDNRIHKLTLPPNDIRIFECDHQADFREWRPS